MVDEERYDRYVHMIVVATAQQKNNNKEKEKNDL